MIINPNNANVIEGAVGNGDGGIKFESINELVWEKELEEVLQVGAQVWQQQQFFQLQMN